MIADKDLIYIHAADHIKDLKGTIQKICDFLELECSEDYLQQCYGKQVKRDCSVDARYIYCWWFEVAVSIFFHRYAYNKDY